MSTRALVASLLISLAGAGAGTILAATVAPHVGGLFLIAGWIASIAALHQLARRGPV
jgi:hypothetical protein